MFYRYEHYMSILQMALIVAMKQMSLPVNDTSIPEKFKKKTKKTMKRNKINIEFLIVSMHTTKIWSHLNEN